MDSLPYRRRADEAERSVYCLFSTLTTTMHTEIAASELCAFGRWTARHDLDGRVLAGQTLEEPFRHLSVGLETGDTLHEVYVVAEPVLEKGQILLDLTNLGGEIND